MANVIRTIDLWLPHESNRTLTYDKVFRAGFDRKGIHTNEAVTTSYDAYRVIKNCVCQLTCNALCVSSRNTAIIFYRSGDPIRLLVDNLPSEQVESYINHALVQRIGSRKYNSSLSTIFLQSGITATIEDLDPNTESMLCTTPEPFLSSCDRWDLLLQFIDNDKLTANPQKYHLDLGFRLTCRLQVKDTVFQIDHQAALVADNHEHYIMFQHHSSVMP